jgi:AbrB family looped-hinge helix DNA binding protein
MAIVTVKNKYQVVIPQRVRDQIGVAIGDVLEATVVKGKIVFSPKSIVDRSIAEGLADIKAGRTYGPFATAAEMAASIEANLKKSRAAKKTKRG